MMLSTHALRQAGVAALLTLAGACSSQDAPQGMPAPAVRTEKVVLSDVPDSTPYLAQIRSRDATDVRAQVTGRVTAITARAGQSIRAGQALMDIDPSRQQAALENASAARVAATAGLERAQAELATLEAELVAARADVQFARQQRDRTRELFAADNVSRQEYDRVTSELKRAEAQEDAIKARITAQEAAVRSQQAAVEQSRSSVAEGRAELAYYKVQASIDGVLGDIPVRVGDLVSPSTLLTTIAGDQGLEAYIQVPAGELPRLKKGMDVEILGRDDQVVARSKVDFVAPQVDPSTQTVLVKAPLQTTSELTTGTYMRGRLIWAQRRGPTVPTTAVKRINTQPFVFVIKPGEPTTVEQRGVTLGPIHQQRHFVESGLEPGETIVAAGILMLSNGMPVTIAADKEEKAEAAPPTADESTSNTPEAPADVAPEMADDVDHEDG